MRINLGATLWGFAEATLFFIVPDVYLTVVGLYDVRKSLVACLYALVGALVGGTIMYYWGMRDVGGATGVLESIPSISTDMLAAVRASIIKFGTWAVLRGPLFGMPYKVFAVQSGSVGVGLMAFLLMTIPARLIRFLIVTAVIPALVNRLAGGNQSVGASQPSSTRRRFDRRLIILLTGWTAFYVFYFLKVPN